MIAFSIGHAPLLFLPLVALVVVTVRSGWLGAAGALVIVAIVSTSFTLAGRGPIVVVGSHNVQALFLQFYLATCFLTTLTVAALLDERQRLTRSLRTAEARYRLLAESSADALLHVDPDGTCRYASPATKDLIGLASSEIENRHLLTFVHPDDRPAISALHRSVLDNPGTTEVCCYRVVHRSGELHWLETRSRGYTTSSGTPSGSSASIAT